MSLQKARILLVPDENLYLAFRLPPIFRRAGWEVDLLCPAGNLMVHSRHVRTVIRTDSWGTLQLRLREILRDPDRPWDAVVVVDEDAMRGVVATGEVGLLKDWQPGALDFRVSEFLLSKFGLPAAAGLPGVNLPPTRVCHSVAEIDGFAAGTGWPVIVKPADETGGRGVVKFDSPRELAAAGATLTLPLLAQKYIRRQRGLVDMLCSAGRPLAWLASYSICRQGGEFTPSTARLFRAMPGLRPMVESLAQFTRFEGFCGFDFIEEAATGTCYLIEFHPRAPSGFRFGANCGVDFAAAAAAWLNSTVADFPARVQAPGTSVAAHYFTGDLFRCLRQRDWRGLGAWLPGAGTVHDIYWDDLPLFAGWAARRCGSVFRKLAGWGDRAAASSRNVGKKSAGFARTRL